MSASYITNHVAIALAQLAWQFQKIQINNLVTAHTQRIQDLEDALNTIVTNLPFKTSTNYTLSRWGASVGMPRPTTGAAATDDTIYLPLILAKIAVNNSFGTPENVLGIMKTLGATACRYYEPAPYNMGLDFTGTLLVTDAQLRTILISATPPINLVLTGYSSPPFGFAGNTVGAKGFGVGKLGRSV